MKKLFSSSLVFSIIILLVYILFTFLRLRTFNFIPSYFVNAGKMFCDLSSVPKNLVIVKKLGYDGQFYYRFSLNPFSSKKTEFGITIDSPPYRHQRILYPFLVWLFSLGGKPKLVPAMMIVVNLMFIFLISYVSTKFFDKPNFYSVVIPMLPSFVLSLSRNLPEIVSSFFVILFFFAFKKKKYFVSSIILTLSALAKETALFISIGGIILCVVLFVQKEDIEAKNLVKVFILPIICWLIWQTILYYIWNDLSIKYGRDNFGFPFYGMFTYLLQMSLLSKFYGICCSSILIYIIIFSLCVVLSIPSVKRSIANMLLQIVWFIFFCEIILGTNKLWDNVNPLRVYPEFFISGFLLLFKSNFKFKILISIFSLVMWIGMAYVRIIKL